MKKFKSIVSLLLVCSMLMGLAACSSSGSSKKKSKKSDKEDRYEDDDDDRKVDKRTIKEIDEDDFKDAVKDVLDLDNDDIYERSKDNLEKYEDAYMRVSDRKGDYSDYSVSLSVYDDEEAAQYFFDSAANSMEFSKDHDQIDGKCKIAKNYVTVDAEVTYGYDGDDEDVYGGTYLAGNSIIRVYTHTGKDRDKDVVDDLLDELGLPKPSRDS